MENIKALLPQVPLSIRRSKRKTVSIYVERDGSVSVIAPDTMEETTLEEIIDNKAYSIYKNIAKWKELNDSKIEREYVSGQSFLYLGRNYRLKVTDEHTGDLILKNGYFLLSKKSLPKAKEQFITFYKDKALPRIKSRIAYFQPRMDVQPQEIRVMELQNRWASCSEKGNLNFHWKCGMAPLPVLDYIIVHEMAHLRYLNHSPAFWNEIDKILPNYTQYQEWLKHNGAMMSL